jgi:hypothetical protein
MAHTEMCQKVFVWLCVEPQLEVAEECV